ncbi:NAD(P)/FAD-dependent oxidoreductase [Mycolicibacterium sp. S2-37]|uniref:phytoene desaturase family protein n=1 Tax=Mycolicibacterium sp. S2-37 TaxID=2810297 RepID=UPI001A93B933|nr:NAD(P)/FAD-dependent oxidoreductase [Mycolicibacterium sp. S2-37]MBO0680270.1 NAD(P)/FAD-dependent oxidoreductase [Mycolicibacterium sp. S2-37]
MSAASGAGAARTATFDAVVIGGGHNGLVAAAYLARAGRRVRVLERLDHVGGAAVSAHAFDGVDARLSRYSYLVSLLPRRIVDDLGARIRLARRRYSSYSPDPATGGHTGLLIGPQSTFAAVGAAADEPGFTEFYRRFGALTERLWPTLTAPLMTRADARRHALSGAGTEETWRALTEQPIAEAITAAVDSDLVRGVMATDALIGTFARTDEPSLLQNICFLYHLIGGGNGEWNVPVGGMGAVSGALAAAAAGFGADIVTGAEVNGVTPDGEVTYRAGGREHRIGARFVLANVGPAVLARLLGEPAPQTPAGSQVKVNLMLRRLPTLRDATVSAEQAFGGTFHINETLSQLDTAYDQAAAGEVPNPLPCEIYCHSLTDPSILSEGLRVTGAHTLTVFGLHTPHALIEHHDQDRMRNTLTAAALHSLNSVLAEPVQDVVMEDAAGRLCIETKTTADLEHGLNMTGGHIFHGALRWPFVEDDETLETPAQRWGVATAHDRILLCGSSARRGGAVSGIGGHNAAMAVLDS